MSSEGNTDQQFEINDANCQKLIDEFVAFTDTNEALAMMLLQQFNWQMVCIESIWVHSLTFVCDTNTYYQLLYCSCIHCVDVLFFLLCYQEPAINEFYDVYGQVPRSLLQHREAKKKKKNKENKEKTDQVTIVELNSENDDETEEGNREEDRNKAKDDEGEEETNLAGPSRLVFHYYFSFELKLVTISSLT